MTNIEKYNKAFVESFNITEAELKGLKYQDITAWDSVGHMELMIQLEEEFDVELDIDDITEFSSYEEGKDILTKYEVNLEL